jgi:hypothetical protein
MQTLALTVELRVKTVSLNADRRHMYDSIASEWSEPRGSDSGAMNSASVLL